MTSSKPNNRSNTKQFKEETVIYVFLTNQVKLAAKAIADI